MEIDEKFLVMGSSPAPGADKEPGSLGRVLKNLSARLYAAEFEAALDSRISIAMADIPDHDVSVSPLEAPG